MNFLVNLADSDPTLLTQILGGNLATTGDGTVSIGLRNGGSLTGTATQTSTSDGPTLTTQMLGGNFAASGNGNISFKVINSGDLSANAYQYILLI